MTPSAFSIECKQNILSSPICGSIGIAIAGPGVLAIEIKMPDFATTLYVDRDRAGLLAQKILEWR
jgi:Holliday junction resolvase